MTTAALGQSGFENSMSGQQIYDNFMNAKGPGDLTQTQDHLFKVMSTYQDRVQQINSLAASMEEGWTGDASEAAQGSATRLGLAHDKAALHMVQASQLIEAQSQAFYDTKNRVVPVPETPKAPSTFENVITLGSANTTYETKVQESQAAAQQNVNAMSTWTGTSADNGSRMPSSYGNLDPGNLNVNMTSPSSAPSVGGGGGVTGGGGAAGHFPGGGGGYAPGGGGGGGYHPPAGSGMPPSGPLDQKTTAEGYLPPPGGIRPPNVPSPISGPGGPARGGLDGWPPVSGTLGGPDTGGGYRGGTGSPGGPGSGSGPGGRAADRLYGGAPGEKGIGTGNRVGAGAPGSASEAAGRAGSAGSAGRSGGAGGMGAGAHGGKGNGEEDAEHQRKYILDDDEPFQLTDEGERLIDPTTGLPVAPPVIG